MLKKGTIVLTPFPFTDLSGNKVRPAIIISDKLKGSDVVVIFLTTQNKNLSSHMVTIKPSNENGLKVVSKAVCSKIATLDKKVILGELGQLNDEDIVLISTNLKKIFML